MSVSVVSTSMHAPKLVHGMPASGTERQGRRDRRGRRRRRREPRPGRRASTASYACAVKREVGRPGSSRRTRATNPASVRVARADAVGALQRGAHRGVRAEAAPGDPDRVGRDAGGERARSRAAAVASPASAVATTTASGSASAIVAASAAGSAPSDDVGVDGSQAAAAHACPGRVVGAQERDASTPRRGRRRARPPARRPTGWSRHSTRGSIRPGDPRSPTARRAGSRPRSVSGATSGRDLRRRGPDDRVHAAGDQIGERRLGECRRPRCRRCG